MSAKKHQFEPMTEFKEKVKGNGQSFIWFYRTKLEHRGIGYAQFIQQINGYYEPKKEVVEEIDKYLTEG